MVHLKHVNFFLVSAFVSVGFGYLTRMFPEKMIFLILIRFFILACLFWFARYDEDNRTFYIFVFTGFNGGGLIAFWDELVLNFTAYPVTMTTLSILIFSFVASGVLYGFKTKNQSKEP